eukprot:COSAG06_NODE_5666_length_3333_cov_35.317873_5_plen_120_part_01
MIAEIALIAMLACLLACVCVCVCVTVTNANQMECNTYGRPPQIQPHAEANGCSVVRTYTGHGCNSLFHTQPNVPHYSGNKAVGIIAAGHTFTIEPMLNAGGYRDQSWEDGWTAVTQDGSR